MNCINLLTLSARLPGGWGGGGGGSVASEGEGKGGQCQGLTHQILGVRQQLATGSTTQTGGSTDFESS